ncbi:hypothetical protein LSAT2_005811 [Lamellibrachia satsuma]|nr:hypothetical protein LSAT2_005811 [Lamellibrachia satsuma]
MNIILAATTLLAGCLALTSAQPQAPETIHLRGWFYFGVTSNYYAWRHGFPPTTTLSLLVTGHADVNGFFRSQFYDNARGNIDDFWTYLSYAHAECVLNDQEEEISLAYTYYVCQQTNGSQVFCPKPCDADPCPLNSDCSVTQFGLYNDNFQCSCQAGYIWDEVQLACVPVGNTTVPTENTTTTTANATTTPLPVSTTTVAPTTVVTSAPPTSASPTIPGPLTWDNLTQLYSGWRYGFPPGTALTSMLPGVVNPDDLFDNYYYRDSNSNPVNFWRRIVTASNDGVLTSDRQLLSLAFMYYVCRETLNQQCPDPCGSTPCGAVHCTVTGAGLFSDEYQCNCMQHYHWNPRTSQCVFCSPGTTWSEVLRQCVQGGATIPGDIPGAGGPSGRWSDWSVWSDCSSECDTGKRSRVRNCQHGPCSGHTSQEERCQGSKGFWLCYNRLLYAGAAALALLFVIGCVLLLLSRKIDEQPKGGYKKLAGGAQQRARYQKPSPKRRPTAKPGARHPTAKLNTGRPTRQPGSERPGQRSKPNPNWPPERRTADHTGQQHGPREYHDNTDRYRDTGEYPNSTDRYGDPREYPGRDYSYDTDDDWRYDEYPYDDQPVSYDWYRQPDYYDR